MVLRDTVPVIRGMDVKSLLNLLKDFFMPFLPQRKLVVDV